jgi:hypothetical protein
VYEPDVYSAYICYAAVTSTAEPSQDAAHWSLMNQGQPGSIWRATNLSGGTPSGATGKVNDYWLDTSNGAVWWMQTLGTYTLVGNITGPAGPTGAAGAKGDTGATGATGSAATIAVGTTTTLSAGSSATVSNSGTSSAATFNFGIPAGATGATGPTGQGYNWRGTWVSGTTYQPYDCVYSAQSAYVCIQMNSRTTPPTNDSLYWQLMAATVSLGSTAPVNPDGPASAGSSAYAMRMDAKPANYAVLLERNLQALLSGQMSSRAVPWVSASGIAYTTSPYTSVVSYTPTTGAQSGYLSCYVCISAYTTGSSPTTPDQDTTHWKLSTAVYSMTGSGSGPYTANGNQGIRTLTTPADWTQSATYESTSTVSPVQSWTCTFYTTGGTVTLSIPSAAAGNGCSVTMDGASWGSGGGTGTNIGGWAQQTYASYWGTVSAGVHTVVLTTTSTGFRIGSIIIPQNPYQGVSVPGDTVELLHVAPYLLVTTMDVGAANNGGALSSLVYGEGVAQRLPCGSSYSSQTCARDALSVAGWTLGYGTPETGLMRLPILGAGYSATDVRVVPQAGQCIQVVATSAARGRTATTTSANPYTLMPYGPALGNSITHWQGLVGIAVVTATGSGSVLTQGQLVLIAAGSPVSAATTVGATLGCSGSTPGGGQSMDCFIAQ